VAAVPPALPYRPFLSGMRSPAVSPLTRFLIGVPLVLLTTETARFFAWTIDPPMTAAFLGANYWSSALLAILASREDLWANGRIAVSVALAFAPLTTLATLIHLDKFHLDTFFGWFWVVAYSIYPPQLIYFLVKQVRAPGTDPPRERPLPMWVRAILGAHAVIMIPLAVAQFVAPGVVDSSGRGPSRRCRRARSRRGCWRSASWGRTRSSRTTRGGCGRRCSATRSSARCTS
jgi:hypothetical protein